MLTSNVRKWPAWVWGGIALTITYVLWLLVVSPVGEFPLNDDWAYSQSVRHLLDTGQLHISDWTSASVVFQVYWGALFAWLMGGFSFTALRWSALAFSVLSCVAFYDLLRQLEISVPDALLGCIALAANPLFVYLSYTFMSDIFYLAPMLLSLSFYVRGIRQGNGRHLFIGSVMAAAAYLSRQLGVLLPVAAAAALLLRDRRVSLNKLVLISGVPLLVAAGHTIWLRYVHGLPWAFQINIVQNSMGVMLQSGLLFTLMWRLLLALLYLGIFTAPVLLGRAGGLSVERPRLIRLARLYGMWLTMLLVTIVGIMVLVGQPIPPMPYLENVINREGIGTLTLSGHKLPVTPGWVFWLVTVISPVVAAAQGALWTEAILDLRRERSGLANGPVIVSLLMAGITAFNSTLWDRYLVIFVPASLYFVLQLGPLKPIGRLLALGACAAMLAYSLIEMGDHLAWNTARWQAGERLIQEGVPPEAIGGGFEWVGWYEFERALPAAIARGQKDELLAWMSMTPDRYVLSFEALEGYRLIDTVPYRSPLINRAGQIYILEKGARPEPHLPQKQVVVGGELARLAASYDLAPVPDMKCGC